MGLLDRIISVCLTLQETAFQSGYSILLFHDNFLNAGPFACLAITPLISFSLPTYTLGFSLVIAFFRKVFPDPRSGLIHFLCSVIPLYISLINNA